MTATKRTSGSVVGVRVDAVTMNGAVGTILRWVDESLPPRVAVGVNAYVCNMATTNRRFSSLLDSVDLLYADGQSVVWAARLLKIPVTERIATTDLVDPLMAACARAGHSVFFFGGKPGVAQQAAQNLAARHPGLKIRSNDGYVSESDTESLLDSIEGHGTDVLFVGLGDPLQQEWIDRHRGRITAPAILTCGGLFDWMSGQNIRAPKWMISAGLEWLWRLIIEPRRLARRYLIGNPVFIARLAAQLVGTAVRKR